VTLRALPNYSVVGEELAAVGYNFRRLIRWLRILLCQILAALLAQPAINPA
jgi:IS5 family transposase